MGTCFGKWGIAAGVCGAAIIMAFGLAAPAVAQDLSLGAQKRAQFAGDAINLAVQQSISQLPPSSGQSFLYEYDPKLGTFTTNEQLGPTAFRAVSTIGSGRVGLRVAASYFNINDSADPINYQGAVPGTSDTALTRFGLGVNAHVTVVGLSATYGITDRIELLFNLPVTVVDAQADDIYYESAADSNAIAAALCDSRETSAQCSTDFSDLVKSKQAIRREAPFNSIVPGSFNEGTHAGVGRISLGAKGSLYTSDVLGIGAMGEFYMPSPSSDQFAGSATGSFLPRLLAEVYAAKHLNLYADVGYDCDFSEAELRRFVWNSGLSIPVLNATFDFGVGGSLYETGLQWTPPSVSGLLVQNDPSSTITLRAVNQDRTRLGTNYVNALSGIKVRLWGDSAVSGAVSVPVTFEGLQPAAVGTLALEYYF